MQIFIMLMQKIEVARHTGVLFLFCVIVCSYAASCGNHKAVDPAPAPLPTPPPVPEIKDSATGLASFYGRAFDGEKTASGEVFNSKEMVAAHPTYPYGTIVRVTNLSSMDTVTVRIIDRGPTRINRKEGVIIDLSRGAAAKLNMIDSGRQQVRVEVLEWGGDE